MGNIEGNVKNLPNDVKQVPTIINIDKTIGKISLSIWRAY
jgi:hypothetical protein